MKKILTLGLLSAAASLGACHSNHYTAAQQEARTRESGSETAQSARDTGHGAVEATRDVGSGLVHGVASAGHATAAGVQYVEHGVSRNDTRHLEAAQQQRSEMNAQADTSAHRFRESGHATVGTARSAGGTVVHAGETGVNAGEQAAGSVRRTTARHTTTTTHSARGGGPSRVPQHNADNPEPQCDTVH